MTRTTFFSTAALLAMSGAALAEVPRVAADITPVHGLVARVMQGLGEPDLVVAPGASPHGYSMRPSEARALSEAEIVFWMSGALTPWLSEPLEELAANAHRVELLQTDGTQVFAFREGARFETHDHDSDADHDDHDEHEGHEEHSHEDGHDDHDDHHEEHGEAHDHDDHDDDEHHDHAKATGHDEHEDHAEEHDHHHDGEDPHAWLLPANAKVWLDVIAAELAEHDPENAAIYQANAVAGKQEIAEAEVRLSAMLEPFREKQFIVFHDAYQYFENGFGLNAAGAISLGDAVKPSPARVAEIQEVVAELNVSCVFSEPQFNPGLVAAVLDGTGAGTAVLDPLGTEMEVGSGFYPALLLSLGTAIAGC